MIPTNRTRSIVFRFLVGSTALLLTGLLFVRFVGSPVDDDRPIQNRRVADAVNLALRRTAHHLLRVAGDSTSLIPPVQHPSPQTFRIQLGHAFDYDQLPKLLQESFRVHRVSGIYNVAVLDCKKGELQLGYAVSDLVNNAVPCVGRAMNADCYTLQVTFDTPKTLPPRDYTGWLLAGGVLLAGLMYVVLLRQRPAEEKLGDAVPTERTDTGTERLRFGNTIFDIGQQKLLIGTTQTNLTYREAKLLQLLVNHTNQLLDRDTILKQVWEDEGVTVGRSVDVFVSRLRKHLHPDPAVRIVAVHGVGYRLEVRTD